MPYWSKSEVLSLQAWAKVQDTFERHILVEAGRLTAEGMGEMLLVLDETKEGDRLYMRLPNAVQVYPMFSKITEQELPHSPSLLVGDQRAYEKFFEWPK